MSDRDGIRPEIIKRYGGIATRKEDCGCNPSGCCGSSGLDVKRRAARIGYSEADLESVPDGSNMGLGCGNPQVIADLKPGEIVLDLGAGGGIDCFPAAKRVGEDGRVIGVDMTPEMVERSRRFAREEGYTNVDFRLGEIENLPVTDASVDVIMSNCVVNLSPDKERVYRGSVPGAQARRKAGRIRHGANGRHARGMERKPGFALRMYLGRGGRR